MGIGIVLVATHHRDGCFEQDLGHRRGNRCVSVTPRTLNTLSGKTPQLQKIGYCYVYTSGTGEKTGSGCQITTKKQVWQAEACGTPHVERFSGFVAGGGASTEGCYPDD